MIDKLQSHYGFTKTPFGRALAPQMLHRHGAHAEAVARIGWCVTERALGVITGEVGAGKTVAVRAALASSTRPAARSSTSATPPSAPVVILSFDVNQGSDLGVRVESVVVDTDVTRWWVIFGWDRSLSNGDERVARSGVGALVAESTFELSTEPGVFVAESAVAFVGFGQPS